MISIVVTILYSIATVFAGFTLMYILGYRQSDRRSENVCSILCSSFLLGLGLLSSLWIMLGLAALLTPLAITSSLLCTCVFGFYLSRKELVAWAAIGSEIREWFSSQDQSLRVLVGIALLFLGVLGIIALVRPPVGDAEAFYMTYPKIIASSQRVIEIPGTYSNFSQIGLLGEMNFSALYGLGDVQSAKLFVWPVAVATILMLVIMANYAGLGNVGLCFVFLLVMTSSAFTNHITDGKVDLFAAAVGIGAVHWALHTGELVQGKLAMRVAGVLAGVAVVGKLSYLPALLPSLFLIVGWNAVVVARQSLGSYGSLFWAASRAMTQFGAWIVMGALPNLIKNAVLFGAPLAPFSGPEGTSWLNQVWFSETDTQWIVLTYPLGLAFGRYPMQAGNLSLLVLAFLPLLFLVPNARSIFTRALVQITTAGVLGVAVWMYLRPSVIAPRYFLATLFLLFPIIALGAERVYLGETSPKIVRGAMIIVVIMALTIVSSPQGKLLKLPFYLFQFIGGTLPECAMASDYCEPLMELNRRAAPGERIYFVGYHSYWLRADLLQCRDDKRDAAAVSNLVEGQSRWETLYTRGFHYVVIDKETHLKVFKTLMDSPMPSWLEVSEMIKTDGLSVYALKPREGGHRAEWSCSQIAPPAWDVTQKAT